MNIQRVYLWAFFAVAAVVVGLCFASRLWKTRKAWRAFQSALLFAAVQCLLSLAFLGCYVLYVKNGFSVSPSRLGVAFFFFSSAVHFLFWRLGGMYEGWLSLVAPMAYSLFLLVNCRAGVLKTLIYNPIYGFIAAETPFPLSAVAALLPLAAACVGRAVALIDKRRRA